MSIENAKACPEDKMMKKLLAWTALSLALTMFTWNSGALAQTAQRIAAVVNDEVISVHGAIDDFVVVTRSSRCGETTLGGPRA